MGIAVYKGVITAKCKIAYYVHIACLCSPLVPLTNSLTQSVIRVHQSYSQWKNGTDWKMRRELELNPKIL